MVNSNKNHSYSIPWCDIPIYNWRVCCSRQHMLFSTLSVRRTAAAANSGTSKEGGHWAFKCTLIPTNILHASPPLHHVNESVNRNNVLSFSGHKFYLTLLQLICITLGPVLSGQMVRKGCWWWWWEMRINLIPCPLNLKGSQSQEVLKINFLNEFKSPLADKLEAL